MSGDKLLAGKLAQVVDAIQTSVGKATDFTVSQLPDVAQQAVLFGQIYYTIGFALAVAFCAVTAYCTVKFFYLGKDESEDWYPAMIASFAAFIISVFVFFITLKATVLVWFAPKIYILKQLAALIR